RCVAARNLSSAMRGDSVGGIGTGDYLKQCHRVSHAARHRSRDIRREKERHDAAAARESHGGADSDETQKCRRTADRVAGVGAESHGSQVGSDRGRGATARPSCDTGQIVRVARVAWQDRAHRLIRTECELGHVGFREHDRTRLAQLANHERVLARYESLEGQRAGGGAESRGLIVVLHYHRNALQRSGNPVACEAAIQIGGSRESVGVDHHYRIDGGPLFVVRPDASQILLYEADARERAVFQRSVDLRDGCFLDVEGRSGSMGSLLRADWSCVEKRCGQRQNASGCRGAERVADVAWAGHVVHFSAGQRRRTDHVLAGFNGAFTKAKCLARRSVIEMTTINTAATSARHASVRNAPFVPPDLSRSQPVASGPTKPPRLPIALTSPIPAAAAVPRSIIEGMHHSGARNAVAPIDTSASPPMRPIGVGKSAAPAYPTATMS